MPQLPHRRRTENRIASKLAGLTIRHAGNFSDAEKFAEAARERLVPELAKAFARTAMLTAGELKLSAPSKKIAELSVAWAEKKTDSLFLGIAGKMADDSDELERRRESKGWQTLARHELTRASTGGSEYMAGLFWASFNRWPVTIWQAGVDSCEDCLALQGKGRSVWEQFAGDGPPYHVGCYCWLLYSQA